MQSNLRALSTTLRALSNDLRALPTGGWKWQRTPQQNFEALEKCNRASAHCCAQVRPRLPSVLGSHLNIQHLALGVRGIGGALGPSVLGSHLNIQHLALGVRGIGGARL